MNLTRIRKINPENPEPEIIKEAATIIRQGGVVVFPTRCLYGLAADARNPQAVDRVISIKQRPADNPILVLIDDRQRLKDLVTRVPPQAEVLMQTFWPGRLTLVFRALESLAPELTAGSGKIGVRIPGHPVALALAQQVGSAITGTSANLSGRPGCHCVADMDPQIIEAASLTLDGNALKEGVGSTVVDVTESPPRILREGQVSSSQIRKALNSV
jgi:L-threonylcarbamoyladenylate synthase